MTGKGEGGERGQEGGGGEGEGKLLRDVWVDGSKALQKVLADLKTFWEVCPKLCFMPYLASTLTWF